MKSMRNSRSKEHDEDKEGILRPVQKLSCLVHKHKTTKNNNNNMHK
jgi:hypothetical protein